MGIIYYVLGFIAFWVGALAALFELLKFAVFVNHPLGHRGARPLPAVGFRIGRLGFLVGRLRRDR